MRNNFVSLFIICDEKKVIDFIYAVHLYFICYEINKYGILLNVQSLSKSDL